MFPSEDKIKLRKGMCNKMSNVNPFSSKFVSAVRDYLKTACADGQRAQREEVVTHLATLDIKATPALVGLAIDMGAIDSDKAAYGLFQGRYGGIREVDLEAVKAEQARQEAIAARVAKANETKAAKKAAKLAAASVSV